MSVAPGSRLGPYEIVSPLGAGGMGEVYRARDTRLGRDVAIKVLPAHLTSDPAARARLEREAKSVSSLNHPHICTLHDIGREGDSDFLVMELVEGESLDRRLARGPLPPAQTLKLGAQIADALDRAHRAGIVHRDLKPGNIMVIRSGVKVMDFGLARVTGLAPSTSGLTQSPTVAQALTAEGTIVGTFQYMAPEQLEGREADARSDIWALGCVLYEMATGRRAFEGASQASLISAIMKEEPRPIAALAPLTPPALERIVQRCLAKDPEDRWQSARDVAHELAYVERDPSASSAGLAVPRAAPARSGLAPALVVAALGLVAAGAAWWIAGAPARDAPALRLTLATPAGLELDRRMANLVLSPDGRRIAFIAADSTGTFQLYVRELSEMSVRALPETRDALMPFWSPDSRHLGFFAGSKLKRVALAGGLPEELCEASGRGGTWGAGDIILFAAGANGPISRVSARGGSPTVEVAPDSMRGENGYRFPRFLADGRRYLYVATPADESGQFQVWLGTVGSQERKNVMRADGIPSVADGWMIYRRSGLLSAQRFDAGSGTLRGAAVALGEAGMGPGYLGAPTTSLSRGGLMMCLPATSENGRLMWVDRAGREQRLEALDGGIYDPALSPDGSRVVVPRMTSGGATMTGSDLWMVDLVHGSASRFTSEPGFDQAPCWSSDGRWVYYSANPTGAYCLYRRLATGGGDPELLVRGPGNAMNCDDVSADGRWALVDIEDATTGDDLWLVSLEGGGTLRPWLATSFNERVGRFSPDGTRIAYQSDESGRAEIYVDAFPGRGAKVQVSSAGGEYPRWRADGRELFYQGNDRRVWSAPVAAGRFGPAAPIVNHAGTWRGWAPSPDGTRILLAVEDAAARDPIAVVNWQRLLRP